MEEKHSCKCKKFCSILGSCLLLLPTGVQWFWGGMATYVSSYFHQHSGAVSANDISWIPSTFLTTRVIGLIGSGYLFHFLSKRWTAVLGVFLFNIGVFCSFFAVQHSIGMLTLTFGAISGLGTGIVFGASLELSVLWSSKDGSGLLVAIVQSSYTFGAIVGIQFMTFYTNPHNVGPDLNIGLYSFFTQKHILDSIPSIFILFGSCSAVTQLLGLILVSDRREEKSITKSEESISIDSTDSTITSSFPDDASSNVDEFTTKQILQSKQFYILWITLFLGNFPYLFILNYYKTFGLLGINDDHFLSVLGTAIVVVSVVTKVIYGFISDRTGARLGLMLVFGLMAVSLAFMYVSLFLGRWAYFFTTILAAIPSGAIFTCHTVATVQIFGSRNVAMNTGLISSAMLAMMLVAPPVVGLALRLGGWMAVIDIAAVVSLTSLVVIAFCL